MEKIIQLQDGKGKNIDVWITKARIDELWEQDINPRSMSSEMFSQLSENIKKRGGLVESLPYCVRTDKGIEIVSGHHRIRASKVAGINEIFIILDGSGLSRGEIIAKQLAHNTISGIDDPDLVGRLFDEMGDVDLQLESFVNVDEIKLEGLDNIELGDVKIDIEMKAVTMIFLPHQMDKFNEVVKKFENVKGCFKGNEIYVENLKFWEKFKKTINKVKREDNIKSLGCCLNKMCEIVQEHYKKKKKK